MKINKDIYELLKKLITQYGHKITFVIEDYIANDLYKLTINISGTGRIERRSKTHTSSHTISDAKAIQHMSLMELFYLNYEDITPPIEIKELDASDFCGTHKPKNKIKEKKQYIKEKKQYIKPKKQLLFIN